MFTTVNVHANQPRTKGGQFTFETHSEPEIDLNAAVFDAEIAEWEAGFKSLDDVRAVQVTNVVSHRELLGWASDENATVAAAAQADPAITANDLWVLNEQRLLVPAGAFANPNFGGLPFHTQSDLVTEAFPDERAVAARNPFIHPELLEILADDDDSTVAQIAGSTLGDAEALKAA